jgi:hypothetical protein
VSLTVPFSKGKEARCPVVELAGRHHFNPLGLPAEAENQQVSDAVEVVAYKGKKSRTAFSSARESATERELMNS